MDVLDLLRQDLNNLQSGPHSDGLSSVVRHIQVAEDHLERGRNLDDSAAFTDAIYRCNQAFEGSVREAYRILAAKDPSKPNIYTIENYLGRQKVFPERVLTQFTRYRTEWRNPSTHDYNLSFNEDEALLAIISVTAFAKLCINQITQKLAFERAKQTIEENRDEIISHPRGDMFAKNVADQIAQFANSFVGDATLTGAKREYEVIGATEAYLISTIDGSEAITQPASKLRPIARADLLLKVGEDSVVIEFKRSASNFSFDRSSMQMQKYVAAFESSGGVLFLYETPNANYRVFQFGPNLYCVTSNSDIVPF